MKPKFKTLLAALFLVISSTSFVAKADSDLHFQVADSTSGNADAAIRELNTEAQSMEGNLEHFFNGLGLQASNASPINVKIYFNQASMTSSVKAPTAHESDMLGFFHHDQKYIALFMNTAPAETKRILRHELVHYELDRRLTVSPAIWVDEGFAEWLSLDASGKDLPAVLRNTIAIAQAKGELGSLRNLLNEQYDGFYGNGRQVRYAEAAALLAYLSHTERPEVIQNLLREGTNAGAFLESKIAGGDLEKFEKNFLTWALQK